jgi:hypothetical protein
VPQRLITHGQRMPFRGRGLFLLAFGTLIFVYGLSLFSSISRIPSQSYRNIGYAFQVMDAHYWGWIWCVVGAIVMVGSCLKFDKWFFTLAQFLFTLWAAFYVAGWIKEGSGSRAWLSVAIWAGGAVAIFAVSSLVERVPQGETKA